MEKIPVQRRLILNPNPEINIFDKIDFYKYFRMDSVRSSLMQSLTNLIILPVL